MTNTTSTEIATTTHRDPGLVDPTTKSRYTDQERAILRSLGKDLARASDADIDRLFMVQQRTGLDPFIGQIYLVGRPMKDPATRQYITQWSVQTGIDGFRQVTRRWADQRNLPVIIDQAVFYSADGQQFPFWPKSHGNPAAAQITVRVGDNRATHVVTWDEYAQYTRYGELTKMWAAFGPTMLAKCAEAGAHRKLCPLTAGLYAPEEMNTAGTDESWTNWGNDQQHNGQGGNGAATVQQHAVDNAAATVQQITNTTGGRGISNDDFTALRQAITDASQRDTLTAMMNKLDSMTELSTTQLEALKEVARTRWSELTPTEQSA